MTAWIDDQEPEEEEADAWQEYASCRGLDPDLFFPERGGDTRSAKAVCDGCPVRAECLDYALTPPVEKFGIWGGMSERERRRIRSQRRSRPDGTVTGRGAPGVARPGNGHRFDGRRPHEVAPLFTRADIERMNEMRSSGQTLTEIAAHFGCSRSVVHKRTKEGAT
jgi:WhiB family transcriptional regulator, redox-sensing transcriptional regulator